MSSESQLRRIVRYLIEDAATTSKDAQQDTDKTSRKKSGRPGRYVSWVYEAGALAYKNPKKLAERLNIAGLRFTSEDGFYNSCFGILSKSIGTKQEMRNVFGAPRFVKSVVGRLGIAVSKNVPMRGLAVFIKHTLIAAYSVGVFEMPESVNVKELGDDIVIFIGKFDDVWNRVMKFEKASGQFLGGEPVPEEKN